MRATMGRLPIIYLSLFLLCVWLQHADSFKDFENRSPKKNRRTEVSEHGAATPELDNIADSDARLDEEAQWRQKIEAKKLRQKQRHEEKELRKKHQRRQERSVLRTYQVRAPIDPPPHNKVAEVARYIVHNADWASVGYTNHHPGKEGLPMVSLFSISDGFANSSTGIPYVYVTAKDVAIQDLAKDSKASFLMTLAETDYCKKKDFDPEDPRCAYVILLGKLKQLKNGTDEWNYASNIYFDRHPSMRQAPKSHAFRFAKLKISELYVQDYFGGMKYPTVKEYFNVKLNNSTEQNLSWK